MRFAQFASTLAVGVFWAALACAQVKMLPPTTAPTTQPAVDSARIGALIEQLGAEDFAARERASEDLRKIGKPALPALKQAARHPDPEVQTRAAELARGIENPPKPKQPAVALQPFGRAHHLNLNGAGQVRIQVQANGVNQNQQVITIINNTRDINVTENNKSVRIHEDGESLKITVTEKIDGKDVTREYKAKNAEELKKNDPEGYKVYEKYAGPQGGLNFKIDELRIEQ